MRIGLAFLASIQLFVFCQQMCYGCIHEEKEAMLKLKHSLLASNISFPSSWKKEDCCEWERVTCNNITGRVSDIYFRELFGSSEGWHLELGIFSSFLDLNYLDLSYNNIVGTLAGLPPLLNNLQVLDLSLNNFTGLLPLSLKNYISLRELYLNTNKLTGEVPVAVFSSLVKIEKLWLEENQLNGTAYFMCNIPSLKSLDASTNLFTGEIPKYCFANATSLEFLDVSNNDFSGDFSFFSFANNSRLTYVGLSGNTQLEIQFNLKGRVPNFMLHSLRISSCKVEERSYMHRFLSSQYQLEYIELSHISLPDALSWVFENNTELMYIYLRNSSLFGNFNLPKYQMTNLYDIDLSDNSIEGLIPTSLDSAFPNTVGLNLSYNSFTGEIPSSLCSISLVYSLDLSNNNLYGEMPSCLLTDLSYLQVLMLSNNKLIGNFIGGKQGLSVLGALHLDGNMLTGSLPQYLEFYRNLNTLDLHDNKLTGHLPESIGDMIWLNTLNLRGNSFHGNVPNHLCNLTSLRFLDLADNFLSSLPNCSMPNQLRFLSIARNHFTGQMPTSFFNNSVIVVLDATDNQFSGGLNWICGLKQITLLFLSRNKFKDSLIHKNCELQNLRMLDLSHNKLFGNIPSYLGNISIGRLRNNDDWWLNLGISYEQDELQYNYTENYNVGEVEFTTKGNYYQYRGYLLGVMIGFDFSDNNFSGEIPSELGNLTIMKSLNLSYNQLTGRIPETLSYIIDIESLDLSHNKLSGPIPNQLVELKFLEVFSVAYNNLSGCLPDLKVQFSTFNISSYIGNPDLHGPPLDTECNPVKALPNSEKEHRDSDIIDNAILYAITAASFVLGFWLCIGFLFWNNRGRYIRIRYIDTYVDSFSFKF